MESKYIKIWQEKHANNRLCLNAGEKVLSGKYGDQRHVIIEFDGVRGAAIVQQEKRGVSVWWLNE